MPLEFTVNHQTHYRYHELVHESYSVVHLQPRSDHSQYCTKFELHVSPQARVFAYADRFGNDVHHFAVLPEHDRLTIAARSTVITVRAAKPERPAAVTLEGLAEDPELAWLRDELGESEFVTFGPGLAAFAAEVGEPGGSDDLVDWMFHAGAAIKSKFSYDTQATSVHTTIDESIRLRAGVCQDFAHIMIGLARRSGIPARYVSGYLFSGQVDSVLGADASHAWCEFYLPPNGWVGFDPTNDTAIDDRFAKIAVGRDYRDVSPVRGVYKGASRSTMSVNVEMEVLPSQLTLAEQMAQEQQQQ